MVTVFRRVAEGVEILVCERTFDQSHERVVYVFEDFRIKHENNSDTALRILTEQAGLDAKEVDLNVIDPEESEMETWIEYEDKREYIVEFSKCDSSRMGLVDQPSFIQRVSSVASCTTETANSRNTHLAWVSIATLLALPRSASTPVREMYTMLEHIGRSLAKYKKQVLSIAAFLATERLRKLRMELINAYKHPETGLYTKYDRRRVALFVYRDHRNTREILVCNRTFGDSGDPLVYALEFEAKANESSKQCVFRAGLEQAGLALPEKGVKFIVPNPNLNPLGNRESYLVDFKLCNASQMGIVQPPSFVSKETRVASRRTEIINGRDTHLAWVPLADLLALPVSANEHAVDFSLTLQMLEESIARA